MGQGGAREPRGRPEAASWVQHGQQTPCRATTAVDRAICCSQVAGALESRVCVGIGACPSQRIGSKVRGVARLSHGVLHCSHGAASELHPARHQPRAPAPHILCVSRLVPREPRSVEMGIVGKPRAARMPLAPSGWSPRPLPVPRQLGRGASVGFYEQKWGFENYGLRARRDRGIRLSMASLFVFDLSYIIKPVPRPGSESPTDRTCALDTKKYRHAPPRLTVTLE